MAKFTLEMSTKDASFVGHGSSISIAVRTLVMSVIDSGHGNDYLELAFVPNDLRMYCEDVQESMGDDKYDDLFEI